MTGLEVPVLGLCAAVVRSTAKIWLCDREVAADARAEAIDVLTGRLTSHLERRQLRRMFDRMEDIVAQRLAPLDLEYRAIPEHERLAAIDAVRVTFQRAALTDDDLFAADLDAGYVYRYLVRTVPGMAERALLSADATAFYDRMLRECCAYLVQITTTLPRCQTGILTELLRRDTEIIELIRDVLTRMPQRRGLHDFEADYRMQVVTALDRVSFFGATLSEPSRKYPLSVAYISLTVSPDDIVVDTDGDYDRNDVAPVQRIEELLPLASRLFVRGEAGSGKTTLLQWIAVRCAAGDTCPSGWGDRTPFLIRLRRYAAAPLPTPERFLDDVGRHVADEMPDGWVHQQLRSGRAIVLVDGVDELPEPRRDDARDWLRELVATFPRSRFVVTSRPAAVAPGWLGGMGFVGAELRPLTPNDVRAFVQRWHDAMRAQAVDGDERAALDRYQELLTEGIAARRTLRRIAETPLLCALLCALHRDRHGHLPDNRMELYEITLHMLLERRDKERGIESPAGLGRIEKTLLLQHLAYWLVLNGLSDAPEDRVVQQIASKLELMPQVRVDAVAVFRHLLERTGLLRESVVARVDFVHRTFQEYLAAKAATDADHIGGLVRNAHLDQWHEVVVMAAGHASPRQREELITGVIRRDDSRDRRYLYLLGLACLETSPELGTTLRDEIHRRVRHLLPPRSPAAARSLAAGGEFVVDLLIGSQPKSLKEIRATIQAASYLGGDAAMQIIAQFGADQRAVVTRELLLAWPRFHPTRYAESVLRESPLLGGHVRIDDPSLISGLAELKGLRRLDCRFHEGHGDLAFVPDLTSLQSLTVADPKVRNLSPLAGTGLKRLVLASTRHEQHGMDLRYVPPEVAVIRLPLEIDLAPLRDVRTLTRLDVLRPSGGWSHLAGLPRLTSLQLSNIINVTRLAELADLHSLTSLSLRDVMWTTSDLTPLAFLHAPRAIGLTNCPFLVELRELRGWADSLEQLWLRDCPDVSLDGLAGLTRLRRLDLSGSHATDLTPISHLTELKVLRLGRSDPLPDLTPLRGLRYLNRLWCYDSGDVDLTPFAGRPGLVVYVSRGQNVIGAQTLGPGSRVERH